MRTRFTISLLVTGLLLSGCAPEVPLELNVRSVAITVPRLITPAVELVEPPATPPPVSLPPPIQVGSVPLPPPPPPPPATVPQPVEPPPPACPDAGPFDVPELPATPIVDVIPAEASYEQRSELTSNDPTADPPSGAEADPLVVTVTPLESTESIVGQRIHAWAVQRTSATSEATSVEIYRLVHPHDSPLATSPGIYLTGMAWKDEIRGELTFDPVGEGLFLLPSPVVLAAEDGVQYAGSATDPGSLTTLSVVRNVTGRKRVDACGDLIDTFTVAMTGTLTGPGRQLQVDWTLQFATSYGGLDVDQTLALSSPATGFSWVRTTRHSSLPEVPA